MIEAAFVNHRGPTLGYRITDGGVTVTYLPDHEPALGQRIDRSTPEWISGHSLARDADLLIHDCQYHDHEYPEHVGWGHSSISDSIAFARRSGAQRLALFHHDPTHDDDAIDQINAQAQTTAGAAFAEVTAAAESKITHLAR